MRVAAILVTCILAGCSWPTETTVDRVAKVAELLIIAKFPPAVVAWAAREGISLNELARERRRQMEKRDAGVSASSAPEAQHMGR